jgi:hypothetical protein
LWYFDSGCHIANNSLCTSSSVLKLNWQRSRLTRTCHAKQWPTPPSKYMGWISDWIFIWHTQGSGRLVTKYSFGVCRVRQISDWIFSWCVQGSGGFSDWIFIQCMHKQITNWIFIDCTRIEYLVVGMIGLGRLELNIQWLDIIGLRGSELKIPYSEWSDEADQNWIFN